SNESTRSLPVIVMSNAFASMLGKEAQQAGANKCLAKNTCGPKKLVEEVRSVLAAAGTATVTAPTPMVQPAPVAAAPVAAVPVAMPFAPAPAAALFVPAPAAAPFAPAPAVPVAAAPA